MDLSPSKQCGGNYFFLKMSKLSTLTFKMDTNYLNHHQSPIPTLWHLDLVLRLMEYMVDVINIAWKQGFLRYSLIGHQVFFFTLSCEVWVLVTIRHVLAFLVWALLWLWTCRRSNIVRKSHFGPYTKTKNVTSEKLTNESNHHLSPLHMIIWLYIRLYCC